MSMPSRSRNPRACSSSSSMRMRQSSRAIARSLASRERLLQAVCERGVGLADLLEQALPRRTQRPPELARPGRGDERLFERSRDTDWQPVCPSGVVRALAQAQAGERERLVAHAADPVRGLPRSGTLDGLARMEEAEPAE